MMADQRHESVLKQLRQLSIALIASVALNAILISCLCYLTFLPSLQSATLSDISKKEKSGLALEYTNGEIVSQLKTWPRTALLDALMDTRLVEDGLKMRDLALGVLVNNHYFAIDRIVPDQSVPSRQIIVRLSDGNQEKLPVFPSIPDSGYPKLIKFGLVERWPITPRGMHIKLNESDDASLLEAFTLTSEFVKVQDLIAQGARPVDRSMLINLVVKGPWEVLEELKNVQEYTPEVRQKLLLKYIEKGSAPAAFILLRTDPYFALKKVDDEHAIAMLNLLTDRTALSAKFALSLLASQRSETVRQEAAKRLTGFLKKDHEK